MKLEFESMVVQNFRTFLGKHKFAFADYGAGLCLMRGRNKLEPSLQANDAGKSTLWDALSYCLFGSSVGGLRAPDLKPWELPDDAPMSVKGEFLVDGKGHAIERSYNPSGLKLDGNSCGQEHVNKLLQMSSDLFAHTILMGQGQPLFFDLQPRDALALFSEGLNLSRWDVRSAYSKDECDRLDRKLAKLEGEMIATKASRDDARDNMNKAKKQSDEWEDGNKASVKALQTKLIEAEKELATQQKLKGAADLAYDGSGSELKAIQEEIISIRASYNTARDKRLKEEIKLEGMGKAADKLSSELLNLGQTDRCPTCNQKITGTSLDKHRKELRRQISELNVTIKHGIKRSILRELATFKATYDKSCEDEADFKGKADDAFSALQRLSTVVSNWTIGIRHLKERIEDGEKAKNIYYEQYIKFKKDLKTLNGNVEEIEGDITQARRLIDRTQPWIKGFKEIRLLTVDKVLEELEFVTNNIVRDLGLTDWKVQYTVEKETKSGSLQRGLNVFILSPRNKKPVKWKCWGGGVSQRLRIAGALALSEVLLNHANVTCNMEILDEPARGMTRGGVRNLCDYLAERAIKQKKTIWFIDHLTVESDKFTDIATVVKDDRGSHVVWD